MKSKKITRKQAIKRVGVSALTAATLLFLSTKESAAGSYDTDNEAADVGNARKNR